MPVEQLRSLQRHESILDAATRVFADKGYHGTLVDEIALEADTSKGGVYFHFPNKQAIFLALFDRLAALLPDPGGVAVAHDKTPPPGAPPPAAPAQPPRHPGRPSRPPAPRRR